MRGWGWGHLPGGSGGWPPRVSMARAMMAWAAWKPNARRMMSRIVVLVDSIRALDSVLMMAAMMASRSRVMLRASLTNWGSRPRQAQLIQRSRASIASAG